MLELLQYVIDLQAAPNGENINANCKLLLLHIIRLGGGEEVEINPIILTARMSLTGAKSIARLLSQLEELDLITLTKPTERIAGKFARQRAFPLPLIERTGIHRDTGGQPVSVQIPATGIPRVPVSVEIPVDPETGIRRDTGSGSVSDEARKDLAETGISTDTGESGTVVAFKSPSPVLNNIQKRGGGEETGIPIDTGLANPAVRAWLRIMQEDITPDAIALIVKRVKYVEPWEEMLEGWKASKWSKTNIAGQIERYQKQTKDYVAPPEAKIPDQAKLAEKERIRQLMYGTE